MIHYIKEIKEGNVLLLWSILLFFLFEEKEVSEGGIDEVRMCPGQGNEVQTLPARVSATPKCLGLLHVPRHTIVGLDGQHVKSHPKNKTTNVEYRCFNPNIIREIMQKLCTEAKGSITHNE